MNNPITYVKSRHLGRWPRRLRDLSASQLFVGSFLLLILIGAIGFRILPGLYVGPELTWTDALFTAVSTVCVTGLHVVDISTYFTSWGHLYLLFLIQLGGLGIITFTTLIITAIGRRPSFGAETLLRGGADVAPDVDRTRLALKVVGYSLLIEAAGFLLLYILWMPQLGFVDAAWPALFHAISAFCNAGFSTYSDSLAGFVQRPYTLTVIMALVATGGIGFIVIEELVLRWRAKRKGLTHRLSLHSRLVLATSGILILGGWLLFAMFEWRVTLDGLPLMDRLSNSLFLSVSARTAGFQTVDYTLTGDNTKFLTIILMSIGGSPGSTAGGLKTTTFALIGLLAWSRMRGRRVTRIWRRSIPEDTTQRAIGVFVVGFSIVTVAIFLFTASELEWIPAEDPVSFLPLMFEAAAAFSTAGLSLGITPDLTGFGRFTEAALMFIGRVGPLTFAAALARRTQRGRGLFYYAYEDVSIG